MLNAGIYKGTIKRYGTGVTKSGDSKIVITFDIVDPSTGFTEEITWHGSLKEGRAREITIDALLACGLKGDDLSQVALGIEGGALDMISPVDLTITNEEWNGVTRAKIAWVNMPGGPSKDMDPAQAVKKLAGMNLKADVAMRRKETGIQDADKIPF